ncbi:MAG: heme-binding protein [Phycisphaerales bacterium JB050]
MRERFSYPVLVLTIAGLTVAAVPAARSAPQHTGEDKPQATSQAVTPESTEEKAAQAMPNTRVAGDLDITVEQRGFSYFAGNASITTPLPEGYPAPTPPGAIDIKHYPSVRRAQVTVAGSVDPDLAQNASFWPLFRHIQANGIAMTAPVEMEYNGLSTDGKGDLSEWTMAFLYRTPDLHPTGNDEENDSVLIIDTEPVTVLSAGFLGDYSLLRVRAELFRLHKWLEANPQWKSAGEPRSFGYNDPGIPRNRRWGEVQLPIRRVVPSEPAASPSPESPVVTEPGA